MSRFRLTTRVGLFCIFELDCVCLQAVSEILGFGWGSFFYYCKVSDFVITSFNSQLIYYKIVYNVSPDKFFNEINSFGLSLERKDNSWMIQ